MRTNHAQKCKRKKVLKSDYVRTSCDVCVSVFHGGKPPTTRTHIGWILLVNFVWRCAAAGIVTRLLCECCCAVFMWHAVWCNICHIIFTQRQHICNYKCVCEPIDNDTCGPHIVVVVVVMNVHSWRFALTNYYFAFARSNALCLYIWQVQYVEWNNVMDLFCVYVRVGFKCKLLRIVYALPPLSRFAWIIELNEQPPRKSVG